MICWVTLLLGSKERFALQFGEWRGGLRRVDAWTAGQWLTGDDNMAYVPQLRWSVQHDRARLDSITDSPVPWRPVLGPPVLVRLRRAAAGGADDDLDGQDLGPRG
jgi:hypothetical protein